MVKRRKTGTTGGNQKSRLQRATPLLHSDNQRLHLTIWEVEQLLQATKGSRNEARDRCLVLLAFRHGLRVSEACHLNLDQVDIYSRVLHVHWLKAREQMKVPTSVKAFFVSERRKPLHRATVNVLLQKYSAAASLPLRAHPHMLRHGCGFALADQG